MDELLLVMILMCLIVFVVIVFMLGFVWWIFMLGRWCLFMRMSVFDELLVLLFRLCSFG